ncbi:HIT family protein [Curtobacterium poinsettiae]|uniref:HIT family protein n=1 Tax=Curtobacterium poinsettiae TaxID=159612 RepID=UPI0021C5FB67|nr:HIT domain-containing protein [Curtobacterium flaccumfaciens]MCU0151349.1 HIT domain-containing protein [Curtobacterium flaccumfaciens pv. poinsettiae]UXN16631.1 HIT domain-containing protein [Curtobacterium flaccumfaciens pv. poinsettiae]
MEDDCPFCEIVARNDPDVREVYRNEHVVAFFPDEPATLGHVLVIPRQHVPDLWALDEHTATHLSRAVLLISKAVRGAVHPEGLNLIQSNGAAATQTVNHLHVHVVPRDQGDAMGPIWPDHTDYSVQSEQRTMLDVRDAVERELQASVVPVAPEDRRKHLDYLQAVITRQSAASSATKGWLLPVVTATYGFALTQGAWPLAVLGILGLSLFAYLDAHYLQTERKFRDLYVVVAGSVRSVPLYTLNPSDAENSSNSPMTGWKKFKRAYIPERSVWRSWSIAPFYGALAIIGIGVIFAVLWG